MVRDSVIHGKKAIIGWEQFKSPYQNIMHSSWLRIYSNDLHEADKHAERIPHKERKGRVLSKPWARGTRDRQHVSRGLWPGSKVCSEHMNDWQYLLLGGLKQHEFFPKIKS